MSDVIDFNEIKNRATDKDLDKFEQYVFGLYYSMAEGKLKITEMMTKIKEYMDKNNISQEKFKNIQTKLLERISGQYGIDLESIEEQMKNLGVDFNKFSFMDNNLEYENLRKTMSFNEKYKDKLKLKHINTYIIKNNDNNLNIVLDENKVLIISDKKISFSDNELNEFLCSYKKLLNGKNLNITLCEKSSSYEY